MLGLGDLGLGPFRVGLGDLGFGGTSSCSKLLFTLALPRRVTERGCTGTSETNRRAQAFKNQANMKHAATWKKNSFWSSQHSGRSNWLPKWQLKSVGCFWPQLGFQWLLRLLKIRPLASLAMACNGYTSDAKKKPGTDIKWASYFSIGGDTNKWNSNDQWCFKWWFSNLL